jgi:hypothetical protein
MTATTNFKIGDKNGEITANKNLVQSNFSLIVIVKDKGGLTDRKEIYIYFWTMMYHREDWRDDRYQSRKLAALATQTQLPITIVHYFHL